MELNCQYKDLKDQSVFITGGNSGIGAAFTEAFLAQGAKVGFVTLDDSTEFCNQMAEKYQYKPIGIQCDITDIAALKAAMGDIVAINGDIEVLVNNAARDDRHSLDSLNVDDWNISMNTNLRPYYFTAQTVAEAMKKNGGGAIINMSSNTYLLGHSGFPAYVAAKAAIMGLTRALARELGDHNIRVNCLIPGWVMTDRQRDLWVTEESLAACIADQCIKDTIETADLAGPCLFLASKTSRMMTGQTMVIDGGRA